MYSRLSEKYQEYIKAISEIGFAKEEYNRLPKIIQDEDALCNAICNIIDTSKELNQIIEQSPTSIYVADIDGKTLRINKNFEETTGIKKEELLGRKTQDIEKENIFEPSVGSIALKEKSRVIIPQMIKGTKKFIVAGVPILNENGEIFRVITNALLNDDISKITRYYAENNESNNKKKQIVPEIIAVSNEMSNVIKLADVIKDTKTTVLIEGETGVGKSLLARYIHYTSQRKNEKMTEINCGAIPQALLESELFGYVSGAFTGADKKGKAGLIEISEGGTILLDEISELPLLLQVKLLHFLQNKRITRVGGTEEKTVDVRVIAATNKNLEKCIEAGTFREDLYYRLNVVPIKIPSLRERKEDIMPAVNFFAEKYTKLYDKKLVLDESCIENLENNYWKGNLRELENYVERIVVTEGVVGIDNNEKVREENYDIVALEEETISTMEQKMIIEAYEKYGSSYKVAKALGISQSTAYRKICKYIKNK